MKSHNFPILLAVIVLVALAAQFLRPSQDQAQLAMRQDLEKSLQLLWEQDGQQVEVTPTGLRANVSMPAGVSPRKRRWNYPFLRLVAQRHPSQKMQTLEVIDGSSHLAIPEVAMSGMLAERWIPPAESEENLSMLTGRKLTLELEKVSGKGSALVLVDAHRTQARRESLRYGRRAGGAVAPSPRQPRQALQLDVCLVAPQTLAAEALQEFRSAHLNHGEIIREVRLPAL